MLEAELDKVKALHNQEMKNMEERVQFAEEREKKARATKDQLMQVIKTFEGDDKNKFNKDLANIKSFYEQMLEDLKSEFEEDVGRYKEQILDLEAQIRNQKTTEHHSHFIMGSDTSITVKDLTEKNSLLERENSQLRQELDTLRKEAANQGPQEGKYLELITDLKNESKAALRASQVEHNETVAKLIADYEKQLAELKIQRTSANLVSYPQGIESQLPYPSKFESPQGYDSRQLDMYIKMSNQDKVELERMKGDIRNLRVSVQHCERRLCESVSMPMMPSSALNSSKAPPRREENILATEHVDYHAPKVNNFSIDVLSYTKDNHEDLNDSQAEYNPLPFKEEALYENSKNKYSFKNLNSTPYRAQSKKDGQFDTASKSMVKIIESDNKEADGRSQKALREISNIPSFPQKLAAHRDDPQISMASLMVPQRSYGQAPRDLTHRQKDVTPRDSKQSHRSFTSKSAQDSEEDQALLYHQLTALLQKVDRSRGHSRPKLDNSQLNRSRTPNRDLNESRWANNDRGFLNFYKENWHSSAFALEED